MCQLLIVFPPLLITEWLLSQHRWQMKAESPQESLVWNQPTRQILSLISTSAQSPFKTDKYAEESFHVQL